MGQVEAQVAIVCVEAQIFICKTAKQILAAAKCTLLSWQLGKQMNSNSNLGTQSPDSELLHI